MFPIAMLRVTQNGIRNPFQVPAMVEFVRRGGRFTKDALLAFGAGEASLMRVAAMPDDRYLLCDGLHRAVAHYLAGSDHLDRTEYRLVDLRYEDFTRANLPKGWLTPYDPTVEVRLPDFSNYRDHVRRLIACGSPLDQVLAQIDRWRFLYAEPRGYDTVAQVAEAIEARYAWEHCHG